jgi:catechol 2,3-dioxygenase-like lactoylglutathione lyase family enzyme
MLPNGTCNTSITPNKMNNQSNTLVPELSIRDFEKSLQFYTQILGFSVDYQRPEEGFAFLTLGSAQIMIDEIGKSRTWATGELDYPLGRGINLQIMVNSLEPLLENLKANQIELFMQAEEKWYRVDDYEAGNRQFLVQDPDGYLLRFAEDLGNRPVLAISPDENV